MSAAPAVQDFGPVPTARAMRDEAIRVRFLVIVESYRKRMLACVAAGDVDGAIVAGLVALHLRTQATGGRDNAAQVEALCVEVRDVGALIVTREARRRKA